MTLWHDLPEETKRELCRYLEENQPCLVSSIWDRMDKYHHEWNVYSGLDDDDVEETSDFCKLLDEYEEQSFYPIELEGGIFRICGNEFKVSTKDVD